MLLSYFIKYYYEVRMKKSLIIVTVFVLLAFCVGLSACGLFDYSVKFVIDENSFSHKYADSPENIEFPEDPVKPGYVFDGWYFDKDVWEKPFTEDYLKKDNLEKEIVVYAKFVKAN